MSVPVYVRVRVCVYLGIPGTDCDSRTPSFPSWQPVCVFFVWVCKKVAEGGGVRGSNLRIKYK